MINIGLQLYSVRDESEKDFIGTIKKVADIGYKGLEFAGYYGVDARELKKVIDDLGVEAVNAHVLLESMQKNFDREIEYANTLGMKTITVPWLPEENRKDTDALKKTFEAVSKIDEKCQKYGIEVCYHNHDFDFIKIDGGYILDVFFKNVKNLKIELDTFWTSYADIDTVEYMKKNAAKLKYIHLKDMIKDIKQVIEKEGKDKLPYFLPIFTEVGVGCLDVDSFVKTAVDAGVEWAFVEQDICGRPCLESVKISLDNLKKKGIAK